MQVIITTTQPKQASVAKHLPLEQAPIVAAVKAVLPNIDDSLKTSVLIANVFTIKDDSIWFNSLDQRYQVSVKVGRNIMEITEVPTQTQVTLKLV